MVKLIKKRIMAIDFNIFVVNKFLYFGDNLIKTSLCTAIAAVKTQEKFYGKYSKNVLATLAI